MLEGIRDTLAELAGGPACPDPLAVFLLIADVALLALVYSPLLDAASLALSLALLAAAGRLGRLKLLAYPAALTAAAAAPLALMGRTGEAVSLAARTLASSTLLLAGVSWLGWRGFLGGLEALGAPRLVTEGVELLLYQASRLSRTLLEVLAARRARLLGRPSWRDWWRLEASAVADLMLRGVREAEALYMAVKARSLGAAAATRLGRGRCRSLVSAPLAALLAWWVVAHVA